MLEYAKNEENFKLVRCGQISDEQLISFLESAIANADGHNHFACEIKFSQQLIGGCSLLQPSDRTSEMGWVIHSDFWGQGYGTEIGLALLRHGFESLSLHRIVAKCDSSNHGSYRIMEKLGMRREGLFVESRANKDNSGSPFSDELAYAILEREWRGMQN